MDMIKIRAKIIKVVAENGRHQAKIEVNVPRFSDLKEDENNMFWIEHDDISSYDEGKIVEIIIAKIV